MSRATDGLLTIAFFYGWVPIALLLGLLAKGLECLSIRIERGIRSARERKQLPRAVVRAKPNTH